ncbi:MAG: hypothetical protein OEW19_15145, partial [Acidobacteriota bacterium]|nr:hypothetical protein [Acidobacteriota bacterium]
LEKKAGTDLGEGFVPVAINTEDAAVAIFERTPEAGPWKLLSTRRTKTMEEELSVAAGEGYRIAAASGGSELVFALVRPADAQPVEYRLLSTTRSATMEKELNDAAIEGWRFVPSSLAALAGSSSLFGGRTSHEAAIVIEKVASAQPIAYRIVGARRVSTIEREVTEQVSQGFGIVAALLGYEETVVILAAPPEAATTVR